MAARAYESDMRGLQDLNLQGRVPLQYIFNQAKGSRSGYLRQFGTTAMRSELVREVGNRLESVDSVEEFKAGIKPLITELQEKMEAVEKRETESAISAFAGETKITPAYAEWLIQQFGQTPFLHIKETKEPIGKREAEALLKLKVRRGGPERLIIIQQTIRALLGVNVDAFEAETTGERGAEMDVDEFLVEANGAPCALTSQCTRYDSSDFLNDDEAHIIGRVGKSS